MQLGDASSVILITSGSLGIAGLLVKGASVVRKWAKRLELFFEDWAGEAPRPGVPERPGVVVRLGRLETSVAEIQMQVNHNHGSSMRDDITAIKKKVTADDASTVAIHINTPGESA